MAKTKFTIDLGNTQLTDEQKSKILDAVHKTINSNVKPKAAEQAVIKATGAGNSGATAGAAAAMKTITINATFINADLSSLTATCQGQTQTIGQSGNISFKNIQTPGVLLIMGKSLGTTTVTITPCSNPASKTFPPGVFRFIFKLC